MEEGTGGSHEKNCQYKQNGRPANDCTVDCPNQVRSQYEQNLRRPNDRWIVRPSQKRPGLYYDFNLETGESRWRDDKRVEPHHHAAIESSKAPSGCYEPTEPPDDPVATVPESHHDSSSTAPKIYNKQIINNQFPFGNVPCKCHHLNSNSNINFSVPPPPFYPWVVPPPVMIGPGPTVSPLNQAQTVFGPLQNFPVQNTSMPLSNQYPLFNPSNDTTPVKPLKGRLGFKKASKFPLRNHHNYLKKHFNNPNDLRNILSGKNRQDLKKETEEYPPSTQTKNILASIAEDEINPDDTDEWLEAHTDDEGKKLTVDMECIWKLADSTMSRDSWYIVPTAIVLVNNIRFFTSLLMSDERARLLAPLNLVRALRSATFSDNARVADYAKRAMILIRQSSKHPDTPKDQPNVEACLELIEHNRLVVLLFDEKDNHRREILNDVPKFTVNEVKQFLTQNSEENTEARVLKIENITIVVQNNEAELQSAARDNRTPSPSIQKDAEPSRVTSGTSKLTLNTAEIKTNLTTTPGKRTVNASVQTDFKFKLLVPTEKDPEKVEIDLEGDTGKTSNDLVTKTEPRKIRLKRKVQPSNLSDSHETKTFKWRKRKETSSSPTSTPSQLEGSHKTGSPPSTPSGGLFTQQNDNANEFGLSDGVVDAKMVDGSSTSGVISNSLDSNSLFNIKKQTVLNESKDLPKDSINQTKEIEYDITCDFMKECLRSRCDEWVSRFTQIMEEVLTQVLHMEPPYVDSTLPPPWNVQEATACIKRKLKHTTIVEASDKFDSFLFKISDDRGNIRTDIRPEDFMQMYSYGVNLINALQMVLKHEDLDTASNYLSQLLSDIREPNLDLTNEFNESFPDDCGSPNISELMTSGKQADGSSDGKRSPSPMDTCNTRVTNMSTTDAGDSKKSLINESPPCEEKGTPCINSPSKYGLRPRRKEMEQKKEERTEVICNENTDAEYSLFSSLGLQKNNFNVDAPIVRTISNVPQDQPRWTPPTVQPEVVKNKTGNAAEPTFIRLVSRCPEIETKLQNFKSIGAEVDYELTGDYMSEDYATAADIDFTKDETIEYEPDGTRAVLNLSVYITTYAIQKCIMNSRKFWDTYENLKSSDNWKPRYKRDVMEKTSKVGVLLKTVCDRLKCILNRDHNVTNNKFRILMKELGNPERNDITDNQVAEYRLMIEKYLEELKALQTFVALLTAAVKKK